MIAQDYTGELYILFLSILSFFFSFPPSHLSHLQEAVFLRVPLLSPPVQGLISAFPLQPLLKSSPRMKTCAAPVACSALWPGEWHVALLVIAVTAPLSILRLRRATRERERIGERGV